ncbi:MAG: hypothetical protein EBZ61_09690, partial [Micrococcales bacterium]|nr:hypothetical protein [Micrococcales bacterium]
MSSMAIFRSPSEMSNPIIGCERCGKNHAVDYPCEFIARIERERNEACEELKRHQDKHAKEINDADAELEKARQDAEHWSNQYHQEHWRANEALKSLSIKQQTVTIAEQTISDQFKRIQRLESERDEARKEIARLQMELDWSCSAEELRQARQ